MSALTDGATKSLSLSLMIRTELCLRYPSNISIVNKILNRMHSITMVGEYYMTLSPQPNDGLYQSLLALVTDKVQEVYCAEKRITTALLQYEESAANPNLKSVLQL